MASTSLIFEDRLDGASNFLSKKKIVTLALKEYDLWELVDKPIVPPTYMIALTTHDKKEIIVERVILSSMKDHLIPQLSKKKIGKEMVYSLVGFFHRTNMNMNMVLRNRLRSMYMDRSKNVTIHFMRIT